jgi:hypothetical protein
MIVKHVKLAKNEGCAKPRFSKPNKPKTLFDVIFGKPKTLFDGHIYKPKTLFYIPNPLIFRYLEPPLQ